MMDENASECLISDLGDLPRRARRELTTRLMELACEAMVRWAVDDAYWCFDDTELGFAARMLDWMRRLAMERDMRLLILPEETVWNGAVLAGYADPKTAPRLDITIRVAPDVYDPCFVIECKRLGAGATSGEYVNHGVLDFVRGRYSPDLTESAMVAYIVSSTADVWFKAVNRAMSECGELGPGQLLRELPTVDGSDACYASHHPRMGLPAIELKHMWFDVREAVEALRARDRP